MQCAKTLLCRLVYLNQYFEHVSRAEDVSSTGVLEEEGGGGGGGGGGNRLGFLNKLWKFHRYWIVLYN